MTYDICSLQAPALDFFSYHFFRLTMTPEADEFVHSSIVAGAAMPPATRICIQHTWFATQVQLSKDVRELKKVGKAPWISVLVDFFERQRRCCFREYLDDPMCHCFEEAKHQDSDHDVNWVSPLAENDLELDDGVEFFDGPAEIEFDVDVEVDDGVEFFDASDEL
jgi:hypothetical protein